jgi:hypothetical protein
MSALIRFSHVHGIEYKLGKFLSFFLLFYFLSRFEETRFKKHNEHLTKIKNVFCFHFENTPH